LEGGPFDISRLSRPYSPLTLGGDAFLGPDFTNQSDAEFVGNIHEVKEEFLLACSQKTEPYVMRVSGVSLRPLL